MLEPGYVFISFRQKHAGSNPFSAVYHLLVSTWHSINIMACPALKRPMLITKNDQSSISGSEVMLNFQRIGEIGA